MGQLFALSVQSFSFNISPSNERPGLIFLLLIYLLLQGVSQQEPRRVEEKLVFIYIT